MFVILTAHCASPNLLICGHRPPIFVIARFRWDLEAFVAVARKRVTAAGCKSCPAIGLAMVTPDHSDLRARESSRNRGPGVAEPNDNAPRRLVPVAERPSLNKVRYKWTKVK